MSIAPSALVFDLGNVLIPIHWERSLNAWAQAARQDITQLTARFSFDADFEAFECGTLSPEDFFTRLSLKLGISLEQARWEQGWNQLLGDELVAVKNILRQLHGQVPLYLLTNTNCVHQTAWQAQLSDTLTYFTRQFISSELGQRKPELNCYQTVTQAIGCAPEHILFFDDLPANIAAARHYGWQTCLVSGPEDIQSEITRRFPS